MTVPTAIWKVRYLCLFSCSVSETSIVCLTAQQPACWHLIELFTSHVPNLLTYRLASLSLFPFHWAAEEASAQKRPMRSSWWDEGDREGKYINIHPYTFVLWWKGQWQQHFKSQLVSPGKWDLKGGKWREYGFHIILFQLIHPISLRCPPGMYI